MSSLYDPTWVESHFDEYGDKEWERLVRTPGEEVKLHVHRHYLAKHIRPGDQVLEIGAGAGRFTQILAELGASVTIVDLSRVQLELNHKHAIELGFDHAVRDRVKLDMCDMSALGDAGFDKLVCYGGPLSHVFDKASVALRECKRVLKPEGIALFSVMSLWGAVHGFLDGVLALPPDMNRRIVRTGNLCPATYPQSNHQCHMFRAAELRDLLVGDDFHVLEMSASNCVSAAWRERLDPMRQDPVKWNHLLELEVAACREPGCLDLGTHLIAVAQKRLKHKVARVHCKTVAPERN